MAEASDEQGSSLDPGEPELPEQADSDQPDASDDDRVPGADIIEQAEGAIGCPVIVYHSAERPLEKWDLRPLHGLLDAMGKQQRAALIIQSPGGNADAAHALSSLLHDYVRDLHIYIVSYAASAATILALAANKLWMGPGSELSPVDPQVPIDPRMLVPTAGSTQGGDLPLGEPIHIPAHVIRDFLELTGVMEPTDLSYPRQKVNPERLEDLFEPLNPWILGWYERADKVSRLYTRDALVNNLLAAQLSDGTDLEREQLADKITHALLDHYASHETGIQRTEARRIGIPVDDCPDEVWAALQQQRDWYDAVIQNQNVGRIMETLDGLHVIPATAERECPHCHNKHDAQPNLNYCPSCGDAFDTRCGQCNRALRPGWNYCPSCAEPISTKPATKA